MGCGKGKTQEHNIMVGRVVVLLCLAWARQVWWCMEQPKGSLLEGHTLFQAMLRLKQVFVTKTTCSLGWFGADTLKPIWVYSSIWDTKWLYDVLTPRYPILAKVFFSLKLSTLGIVSIFPAKAVLNLATLRSSRTGLGSWIKNLRWWSTTWILLVRNA